MRFMNQTDGIADIAPNGASHFLMHFTQGALANSRPLGFDMPRLWR